MVYGFQPSFPHAPENSKSCVVIDGHAMIQKLGKPANCQTFADNAEVFMNNVLGMFQGSVTVTRVDIAFDRYIRKHSMKTSTRKKRVGRELDQFVRPRRRIPLPQSWEQFIALAENKADLATFLSN